MERKNVADRAKEIADEQERVKIKAVQDQQQKEQKRKETLSALASAPRGSEDACENTSYLMTGNGITDDMEIKCQLSGDGLKVADLKKGGWITTNVQFMRDVPTATGMGKKYLITIKKAR